MEIRLLRYVIEVYRKQSFTKAAESLHIAQPSLSQQIAKLEQELHVRLFVRGHGKVVPTPEGERFIKQAEVIIQLHDDLECEMKEKSGGISQDVVIGTTAITGGRVLPPLIQAFEQRYPEVGVQLVEESTTKLIYLTNRGQVDLSVLALPIEDQRLTTKKLLTEPLFLAVPGIAKAWMPKSIKTAISVDHGITTTVSLSELADAPFILLKKGYGFRSTLLALCAESGFQPHIAYETSSIETAQALVAYGLGVTLVPKMAANLHIMHDKQPRFLRLNSQPTRTLVFAYQRNRYLHLAARAFLELVDQSSIKSILNASKVT